MTKRRPWWSEQQRAAAFVCGVLLLAVPPLSAAAVKQSHPAKPAARVAARPHKASEKVPARPARPAVQRTTALPGEDFGPADLQDDEPGLRGKASYYGRGFHGRKTATGDIFDAQGFSAASNRFPLNTTVAVQRVDNGRCVVVRINDRMHPRHRIRIIDLSYGAAVFLDMLKSGVVFVRVAPLIGKGSSKPECQRAFDPLPSNTGYGEIEKEPKTGKFPDLLPIDSE